MQILIVRGDIHVNGNGRDTYKFRAIHPFDFYSVINEPKINVTKFTVKLDNFHETRQTNKTLIANLSMSAIKEIKAKTINPVIGTQHFMISAHKDH